MLGLIAADAGKAGTGPIVRPNARGQSRAVATAHARAAGNALARGALRANHARGASQGGTGSDAMSSAIGGQPARRMGIARMTEAASATQVSRATNATNAHRASTGRIAAWHVNTRRAWGLGIVGDMEPVYVSTRHSAEHVPALTGMEDRDVWNVRRDSSGRTVMWNAVEAPASMGSAQTTAHANATRASEGTNAGNARAITSERAARSFAINLRLAGDGDHAENTGSAIVIQALLGRTAISATME